MTDDHRLMHLAPTLPELGNSEKMSLLQLATGRSNHNFMALGTSNPFVQINFVRGRSVKNLFKRRSQVEHFPANFPVEIKGSVIIFCGFDPDQRYVLIMKVIKTLFQEYFQDYR